MDRVLFAGGGTGGHIYMAVALRTELKWRYENCRFLFVGTRRGLENRILPPLSFPLSTIDIGGLKGLGAARRLKTLAQIPLSLLQSRRILRQFSPDIVVGLGGYSSGPVVMAGWLGGYPSILIEPNVQPGFTNRLLGRWVGGAAVAFDETASWFPGKARLTGIPIRPEFHQIKVRETFQLPLKVLIFGGSRGSQDLNNLVCEALPKMDKEKVSLRHQTGWDSQEVVRKQYEERAFPADVIPYIDNMPGSVSWADVVISRAGACTVAEITAAGRPSILIPYPYAADDHQRKNAEALQTRGASVMLDQFRTSGSELAAIVNELTESPEKLKAMARASRSLARPKSTTRILGLMEEILAGK